MQTILSVNGVPIRLTQERLSHIYQGHPEMRNCRSWIEETLSKPEKILHSLFHEKTSKVEEGYMATLKIPERTNSVIHYDPEADVLYISFGEPKLAEGLDIGDSTILRVNPETEEIVGLTILDFSKRTGLCRSSF